MYNGYNPWALAQCIETTTATAASAGVSSSAGPCPSQHLPATGDQSSWWAEIQRTHIACSEGTQQKIKLLSTAQQQNKKCGVSCNKEDLSKALRILTRWLNFALEGRSGLTTAKYDKRAAPSIVPTHAACVSVHKCDRTLHQKAAVTLSLTCHEEVMRHEELGGPSASSVAGPKNLRRLAFHPYLHLL